MVQGADITDVFGQPVVVYGQLAFLAKEKSQVNLLQGFTVAVVTVLEVFIQLPVGRNRGDIITKIIVIQHYLAPLFKERLLSVSIQAPQDLTDTLAGQLFAKRMGMAFAPGLAVTERPAPCSNVVGHAKYLL
ncbi:MAG: hypothetical protein D5S00_07240 [Tindallia sp. MSAO_Bac2]|nr:MAG: hypothetical protein D5S00_07240 [Tindallia sp. MSAO_Bac2]